MTDDQLGEWASKVASEIVKREGAALALSACDRDEPPIKADSNLLGIAIAKAIIEARGLRSRYHMETPSKSRVRTQAGAHNHCGRQS